jgi:hypothetical protein
MGVRHSYPSHHLQSGGASRALYFLAFSPPRESVEQGRMKSTRAAFSCENFLQDLRRVHMLYARLGKTGLLVSKLAFGAMTFGSTEGPMAAVSKVGQKGADEMVGKVLDAGVNFFNTADAYTGGQSEQMLAAALGNRRL